MPLNLLQLSRRKARQIKITLHHAFADHAHQPHALPIFRAKNPHALRGQFANLRRHDHAAAAAKHLDMRTAALLQELRHVFEILDMPALIAAHANALHILLQRSGNHIIDRAVVPQMNHLAAKALQDAPHDVDAGIMAIKQRGRRHKAHFVFRAVFRQGFVISGQFSHGSLRRIYLLTLPSS